MLRNRSRALMADHNTSLLCPTKNPTTPISSFLGSPRLFFNGFLAKNISDHIENNTFINSPTSILDAKSSSNFVNPFGYDRNFPKSQSPSPENNNKSEPQAIGLALIDSIIEEQDVENDHNFSKPINRMALFGSKLKVQIPVINNPSSSLSPNESPKSPADFGIKTRNSQLSSPFCKTPSKDFSRQLSLKEMELSEDYTRVITHGPNPKTTHIYDDCIVESCFSVENNGFEKKVETFETGNFMSFCYTCKDILGHGKDIYIYRGEKAFCSHECRSQEMYFEGMKNQEMDDAF